MSKKIVTVFGATGNQGGSVITTFLNNSSLSSQFSLRAITRNTSSDKAKALGAKGVELATADLDDPSSLNEALKGSHAVFAVTNYWESMSTKKEVAQGKAIADAAVATGVKHLVWSSLPHVTNLTNGTLKKVEHFDGKSNVETYIESVKGKTGMVGTYVMPGFYMPNVKSSIKKDPDTGVPTYTLPWDPEKTQVPLFDPTSDMGTFVGGIVAASDPKTVDGRHIHAVSQWSTPNELVKTISEVSGTKVDFKSVPESVFVKFLPEAVAQELTENMVLIRDYSYYGKGAEKEQKESDEVLKNAEGLKPTSWKEYVEKNGPWQW